MKTINLIYERQEDGILWREIEGKGLTIPYEPWHIQIELTDKGNPSINFIVYEENTIPPFDPEALRQLIAWAEKGERPSIVTLDIQDTVEAEVGKVYDSYKQALRACHYFAQHDAVWDSDKGTEIVVCDTDHSDMPPVLSVCYQVKGKEKRKEFRYRREE